MTGVGNLVLIINEHCCPSLQQAGIFDYQLPQLTLEKNGADWSDSIQVVIFKSPEAREINDKMVTSCRANRYSGLTCQVYQ